MSDNNKVAIVTGASRGIGAATSERLAMNGFNVLINYSSADPTEANVVAGKVRAAGVAARTCRGDVSDPKTAKEMFDLAETDFGGVDVLVNNAGIMELGKIADVDNDTFDRHIAINLKGAFNFLREAANRMRKGGRDISVNAVAPGPTATNLFLQGKSDALLDRIAKMNPFERLGTPDEIAA